MRGKLRVTERIYGPGPTRRSRVLLAVPGRDYPADFVLAAVNGDESLIDRDDHQVEVVDQPDVSRIERKPVDPVVVADETDSADETDQVVAIVLESLAVDDLRQLAADRGIELPSRATKVQIIGALQAADQTED